MGEPGVYMIFIPPRRRKSNEGFILLASILLLVVLMTGCAKMGATRSLNFTEFPPPDDVISAQAKNIILAIEPFDVSSTNVKGGHYEGLLQVRQPGIWGLSPEQKETLYGNVSTIVRFAFIDELLKLSKKLMLIDARMPVREADYVITGTVQSVELNTYGHGTKEGIGSAGDYWEARVVLTGVS